MLPAAHVVGPVHPVPPHCPYFAAVPPALVATAELVVVATLLVVEVVTSVVEGVVACVVAELDVVGVELPAADPPLHTAGPGGV